MPRQQELLVRRERLIARSGQLRGMLGAQTQALQPRLAWAERVQAGWLWLRAHPQWLVGGAAAGAAVLVVLRPSRILRWSGGLVGIWQLLRRAQPLWAALGARRR